MANTTFIKNQVEPFVQRWLEDEGYGERLEERKVELASKMYYNFDAVTEDGSVVAAILSNRAETRGGNENTGGVRKALTEIAWLSAVKKPGARRLMVFTDADFMELITKRSRRLGDVKTKFLFCRLPEVLQSGLAEVLAAASKEHKAAGDT